MGEIVESRCGGDLGLSDPLEEALALSGFFRGRFEPENTNPRLDVTGECGSPGGEESIIVSEDFLT